MGFLFGLAYALGTGAVVLSISRGLRLTRFNLFTFVIGSFAGAIGCGWIFTQAANAMFGAAWPFLLTILLILAMGTSAVVAGYIAARAIHALGIPEGVPPDSRDLEGPTQDDSSWE